VGAGVSIGASVAHNFIGYDASGTPTPAQVRAYVKDSSVSAAGDLAQTATADETINAVIVAASAAIAGGRVGVTGGGPGTAVTNKISTQVEAYIDGDGDGTTGIEANHVSLTAQDQSVIKADAESVTLAVSVAPVPTGVAVSISIGTAQATNSISNDVEA